jgi:hypothetical protein
MHPAKRALALINVQANSHHARSGCAGKCLIKKELFSKSKGLNHDSMTLAVRE